MQVIMFEMCLVGLLIKLGYFLDVFSCKMLHKYIV